MKPLFNIFTKLKEKLRLMIIKTFKNIIESQLKYFYIEIYFYHNHFFNGKKKRNHYKLPLIVHVVDRDEATLVQELLLKAILKEKLTIESVKKIKEINFQDLEKTKQLIINSQTINGFETINIILEKENLEFNTQIDSSYIVKVNTLKKGHIPLKDASSLFIFRIDKSKLED